MPKPQCSYDFTPENTDGFLRDFVPKKTKSINTTLDEIYDLLDSIEDEVVRSDLKRWTRKLKTIARKEFMEELS